MVPTFCLLICVKHVCNFLLFDYFFLTISLHRVKLSNSSTLYLVFSRGLEGAENCLIKSSIKIHNHTNATYSLSHVALIIGEIKPSPKKSPSFAPKLEIKWTKIYGLLISKISQSTHYAERQSQTGELAYILLFGGDLVYL